MSNVVDHVRRYGWSAVDVSDATPPFLYTAGLLPSFQHPELIIFGLERQKAYSILAGIVQRIRSGESFHNSGVISGIEGPSGVLGIRRVHPTQHSSYLFRAMAYCMFVGIMDEISAIQVFWADANGKFPFDGGCDPDVYRRQPRLDIPLTPG